MLCLFTSTRGLSSASYFGPFFFNSLFSAFGDVDAIPRPPQPSGDVGGSGRWRTSGEAADQNTIGGNEDVGEKLNY